jgi:CRISPR-associated protein Cmr6
VSRFYVPPQEARRAHAGLRMDKFMNVDDPEWPDVAGQNLDDAVYRLAYQRWETFWKTDAPEGRVCVNGRVKGRMAVGLGAKGVLEVGLRLSHSYGVPVIPASAVKGALRGALEDAALISFLFGSEDRMGFVGFQDAWWVPESKAPLAVDVMTVHHPEYYSGKGPPSDCDSPNPVQFLSMRGSFLFVADAPNKVWRDYVEKLLVQTLEKQGIGAKTAAGYGRFVFGG